MPCSSVACMQTVAWWRVAMPGRAIVEKVSDLTRRAIQGSAAVKAASPQVHGFDRVRRICQQQAVRARQEMTLGFFLKVWLMSWVACSSRKLFRVAAKHDQCSRYHVRSKQHDVYATHKLQVTGDAFQNPFNARGWRAHRVERVQVLLLVLLRRLRPRAAKRLELLCLAIPLPAALAKLQVPKLHPRSTRREDAPALFQHALSMPLLEHVAQRISPAWHVTEARPVLGAALRQGGGRGEAAAGLRRSGAAARHPGAGVWLAIAQLWR